MNYRIKEIRNALKISQKEFAEKIGLKQNAISYMEKPGNTVTEQNIKNICAQFDVNEEWLKTGQGRMFLNQRKKREFFNIFEKLSPALQDYLIESAKELLSSQQRLIDELQSQSESNFKIKD